MSLIEDNLNKVLSTLPQGVREEMEVKYFFVP